MRTKLCPSRRRATSERTIQACSPAAASPWSFVLPYAESGGGRVRLDVRRALPAVEHVVGRERDERRAERGGVRRAADVGGRRALGVVLGPVDVRPRRRMEHEVRAATEAAAPRSGRPTSSRREGEHVVVREATGERMAELAAGAGDQGAASRAERIGVVVLHRCATRGSFHGTPCSSGSSGSYSSVTW